MGSFFSKCFRKSVLDIETSEGWDQRMQEFQDVLVLSLVLMNRKEVNWQIKKRVVKEDYPI